MADPDIPLAMGIPIPLAPPMASAPEMIFPVTGMEEHGANAELTTPDLNVLKAQGFTSGLAQALQINKRAFALSIWIVDNSGSMQTHDGQRIIELKGSYKFIESSRWAEMQQTVDYHAQLSALLKAPTTFRMLNDPGRVAGPQEFSITAANLDHDLAVAQQTMQNAQPGGVTPLLQHMHEIRQRILLMEPQLRQNGTKVTIVLATDGLPTDNNGYSNASVKQQFVESLRALEGLPVWIVVRLCTDEDNVVEFWNDLDSQLELSLEVLDDWVSEAKEVHEFNKWLTYGLPLHRMRELGYHNKLFDLLDERKFSKDEVRDFMRILFGGGLIDEAPDPEVDWKGFCAAVETLVTNENKVWNPVNKRMEPWVDMKKLYKEYSTGWFW